MQERGSSLADILCPDHAVVNTVALGALETKSWCGRCCHSHCRVSDHRNSCFVGTPTPRAIVPSQIEQDPAGYIWKHHQVLVARNATFQRGGTIRQLFSSSYGCNCVACGLAVIWTYCTQHRPFVACSVGYNTVECRVDAQPTACIGGASSNNAIVIQLVCSRISEGEVLCSTLAITLRGNSAIVAAVAVAVHRGVGFDFTSAVGAIYTY